MRGEPQGGGRDHKKWEASRKVRRPVFRGAALLEAERKTHAMASKTAGKAEAKASKSGRGESRGESRLTEHPSLLQAVESFIKGVAGFESSVAFQATLAEASLCTSPRALFEVPIKQRLFSMDAALSWMLFLSLAPGHAAKNGDALFSPHLKAQEALDLIADVYDAGVDELLEHFEEA